MEGFFRKTVKVVLRFVFLGVAGACLLLLSGCAGPVRVEYPGGTTLKAPVIRVGLVQGAEALELGSTGGMRIYKGMNLLRDYPAGKILCVPVEGGIEVRSGEERSRVSEITLVPERDSLLKSGERTYRGLFTLSLRNGKLLLINLLSLEDYVRGVLPYELSSEKYPEIEALKAQAVAARTYALYTRGKFEAQGFDICSTEECQVYGGTERETLLSNKAVEETEGKVVVYGGSFAKTLYSSTCGGHTESNGAVFLEKELPYLVGRPCQYDNFRLQWIRTSSSSGFPPEIGLALALNLVDDRAMKGLDLPLTASKAEEYFGNLGKITGRAWKGRVEGTTVKALLPVFDHFFSLREKSGKEHGEAAPEERVLLYLQKRGFSGEKGEALERPLTFRSLLVLSGRLFMGSYTIFTEGTFPKMGKEGLIFQERGALPQSGKPSPAVEKEYSVDPAAFLYRDAEGVVSPATLLFLTGAERVQFLEVRGKILFMKVLYPPFFSNPDSNSLYPFWHKRYSRDELEARLRQYMTLDRLVDIVPVAHGASGRVTGLEVQGIEGSKRFEGIKIKTILGLRDLNFFLDREFGPSGEITGLTFLGRGWGHGVGLCQVGAYGMAKEGSKYKEILLHYYPGTRVENLSKVEKRE